MLLNRKLWLALNHPPRNHPLFRYVMTHASSSRPMFTANFFLWMFIFISMSFCWLISSPMLPLILLLVFICGNTAYGLRYSLNISANLYRAKDNRSYDIFASLPDGNLITSWAMCTGHLHRDRSFFWVPTLVRTLVGIILFMLLSALLITGFVMSNNTITDQVYTNNFNLIPAIIIIATCVVLFYIDHTHSITLSILVGILAPVDAEDEIFTRLRATGIFAVVQLLTYATWLVITQYIFVGLFQLSMPYLQAILLTSFWGILSFWLMREISIRIVWRIVTARHNAAPSEIQSLMLMTMPQDIQYIR